ncbi:MAG: IS1 family transposase, partial [Dysgonomonas sp.]
HYLARFKRKGKCYSKAEHMVEKSLKLLFLKPNNEMTLLI